MSVRFNDNFSGGFQRNRDALLSKKKRDLNVSYLWSLNNSIHFLVQYLTMDSGSCDDDNHQYRKVEKFCLFDKTVIMHISLSESKVSLLPSTRNRHEIEASERWVH